MIVGITGNPNSGRKTAAKILQRMCNIQYNFDILDDYKVDLRDFVLSKTGISTFSRSKLEKTIIDEFVESYRRMLNRVNPDIELNIFKDKINKSSGNIIVTGNFGNDLYSYIKDNGGEIVYVFINSEIVVRPPLPTEQFKNQLVWERSNNNEYLSDTLSIQLKGLISKLKNEQH